MFAGTNRALTRHADGVSKLLEPRPHSDRWLIVSVQAVTIISRALATYAVVQGLQIILLDDNRWSGPAFRTALTLPGAPDTWGAMLALSGALALTGSLFRQMTLTAVGHFLAAVWSVFFAGTVAREAVVNANAPTTGIVVYGLTALLFLVVSTGAWQLRQPRRA